MSPQPMLPRPCRSCQEPIFVIRNIAANRSSDWLVINTVPTDNGNITADLYDRHGQVLTLTDARAAVEVGKALYLSHHATCPAASEHRKPKSKDDPESHLFNPDEATP